jgi:hypothetical protein
MEQRHILQQTISNKIVLKKWKCLDDIIKAHPKFNPQDIQKTLNGETRSANNFFWSYLIPEPEVYTTLKDFPDFDVSTYGNVKNNKTGELVEKMTDHTGYQYVVLHNTDSSNKYSSLYDSENELCFIHYLVAATHLGNKNFVYGSNYNPLVYHKDGDKSNNSCENLTFDRPFKLPVRINQIDLKNGRVIRTFPSLEQAKKVVSKLSEDSIIKACTGRCNSAGGFAWEFVM